MRVAVTGASGWLGRAAVAVLRRRGTDVTGFASTPRGELLGIDELPDFEHDVLLHYAFVTREYLAARGHEAYVAANLAITACVAEAVRRNRPAMFYASSGAVHHGGSLTANPYGVAKRLDEHLFRDLTAGRCSVARVYNVAGPHVTKPRAFAVTDLTRQSLDDPPRLRVAAQRRVVRSFVDVEDLAAYAVASAGQDRLVETAGSEEIEVGALAGRIAPALAIERPPLDPMADDDRYVGDAEGFLRSCTDVGVQLRPLDEQLIRTREWLVAHG